MVGTVYDPVMVFNIPTQSEKQNRREYNDVVCDLSELLKQLMKKGESCRFVVLCDGEELVRNLQVSKK